LVFPSECYYWNSFHWLSFNFKESPEFLIFWKSREKTEDGKELHFDHGAPLFSVSKPEVARLVQEWESRGLVAEWREKFGSFDIQTLKFDNIEQVHKYSSYV